MLTETTHPAPLDLVGAMVGRARPIWDAYVQFMQSSDNSCPFCRTDTQTLVEATHSMQIIRNLFPYAVWDSRHVEDHLMVIPTRHVLSLDEYTDREAVEFFALVRRYEASGYSLYSRAPTNTSRSVGHAHTHLIKTSHPVH